MLMNDWARIAEHVGQRSGDQCSKRWREVLDPAINKTCWTPEEDRMLIQLFQTHGSCWQVISTHFNNRRALQCRNRCCKLLGLHSHQRVKKTTSPTLSAAPSSGPDMTNNQAAAMVVPSLPDIKLPFESSWQNQTSAAPTMLHTSTDALATSFMPQMFDLNGLSFSNNQMGEDYVNTDETNTTHFVDAWNKVQGFSSTERKGPPASLNLVDMDPSLGSQISSPGGSSYSPTTDPTQFLNTASESSSLDASPSTPFTIPNALQPNQTTTCLGSNMFSGGTLDVSDGFFLSSPSLTVPPFNLDETMKIPSNQAQMSSMLQLPSSLQEFDLWSANTLVM